MVDLRSKLIDIEQQDKVNSCVAHAVTSALEMALGDGVERSRMFLYYVLRETMGTQALDSGAKLEHVGEALIRTGVPPESLWPYDRTKLYIRPSESAYKAAGDTTITRWSWVNASKIKEALDKGIPVICAIHTRSPLRTITGQMETHWEQLIGYQSELRSGAHAVLIVGYSDQGFIIANSFGTEYGDNGFLLMPAELLMTDFIEALTIEAEPRQVASEPPKDDNTALIACVCIAAAAALTKMIGLW